MEEAKTDGDPTDSPILAVDNPANVHPDATEHFLKLHDIMNKGVGIMENGAEYTVGPWLKFDPKTEKHIGDHAAEANALLKDDNRSGFKIPTVADV